MDAKTQTVLKTLIKGLGVMPWHDFIRLIDLLEASSELASQHDRLSTIRYAV